MGNRAIRSLSLMVFVVGVSGTARAAEIQRWSFQGSQAEAFFFGSSSITCTDGSAGFVSAIGYLYGAEQILASPGSPPSMANGVFVTILSYSNSCTGQMVVENASGVITNGFTPPDKQLSSASMVGSTLVEEYGTGVQLFTVSIAVEVVGIGQQAQDKAHGKTTIRGSTGGPITISMRRGDYARRFATTEGTISIDGVDIVPEFSGAILFANSSATRTVTRTE